MRCSRFIRFGALLGLAGALAVAGLALAARAQPAPPLNFVVVLTDDQRFDTLFAMPRLQSMLAPRAVVFEQALATTPLCCPFRASFLGGGFLAHRTGVLENAPPNGGAPGFRDGNSLARRLQQAGYATALFGKYMNSYQEMAPYVPPGWTAFEVPIGDPQGASTYSVSIGSSGDTASVGSIEPRSTFSTDYFRDRTLAFIQSHAADPFFVLLALNAPHYPAAYLPKDAGAFSFYLYRGRGYGEADLSDKPARVQAAAAQFTAIAAGEDLFHRNQLRALQEVDRAVVGIFSRLESLGLLERTVIVFASDNGFLWGEHGMVGKTEIYEESIRVPLLVAAPGFAPGSDEHLVAVNLDLPATILDLAGLPPSEDGRSLVPLLEGGNPDWRESVLIEAWRPSESWSGLRIEDERGSWKYVEHTRGEVELYDLANDPFELENLANQPSHAAFVAALAAELAPQKGLASRTHSAPNGRVGVAYTRALQAWGGTPPYAWRLFSGSLPPGIALDPALARLTGTPTTPGTWSFVVEVADSAPIPVTAEAQAYRQALTLHVHSICEDGLDNDADGLTDFPADPGCSGPTANLENPRCNDGLDNDGDGKIDFDGSPPDPDCTAAWLNREAPVSRCGLGFEIALALAPLAWLGAKRRRARARPRAGAGRALGGTLLAAALALLAGAAAAAPRHLFSVGQATPRTPETFGWVTGLGVDSSTGDVFIPADGPIRRFDANGNFILEFGSCPGCRGMDVDVASHDLYAADGTNDRILQYTRQGQLVRQWGSEGTGNGQFLALYDVSVDSAGGQLFAIDGTRVQVFDLQGNFLRAWGSVGSGWGQFSGEDGGQAYGVAFDPLTQTVWTSDARHDRIYAFDEQGNLLGGWDDNGGGRDPGQMRWARNVDVDAEGNVYEVDPDNERIQVFAPDGTFLELFRGPHDLENGAFHPRGIAVNRTTGDKWVAAAYAQRVDKFDAANQYLFSIGDRQHDGTIFWSPLAIAVSEITGEVFVDDANDFLIKRFSRTGAFLGQWGGSIRLDPWTDGQFGYDSRTLLNRNQTPITVDPDGNLWLAGYGTRYLGDPHYHFARRLDPLGNFLSGWKPNLTPQQAYGELALGIAIDPVDGRVFISDAAIDRLRVHGTAGAVIQSIPVPDPGGIAATDEFLYVVAAGTQRVRKYDRAGVLLREWGGPGTGPGQFNFLQGGVGAGIAVDSTGKVYVTDSLNHRVQVFDGDGGFIQILGSNGRAAGQFKSPYGLAVARATDTLYVADSGNERFQAFALETSPRCFDGLDNDADGRTDFASDPGCAGATGNLENPRCNDGLDNDGDGKVDFDGTPPDPDCTAAWLNRESPPSRCGLGFELALLAPLLCRLARRRQRGRCPPRPDIPSGDREGASHSATGGPGRAS